METIDFIKLNGIVNPDTKRISYEDNKHLFHKVAFDVFQMSGAPVESYWILEKDEDGKEYLVANYEEMDAGSLTSKSDWEALSDKKAENVTLFYKNVPIKRFASQEFGFDQNDVHIFKQAMVDKLSKDKAFIGKLIDNISEEKKQALLKAFPELSV